MALLLMAFVAVSFSGLLQYAVFRLTGAVWQLYAFEIFQFKKAKDLTLPTRTVITCVLSVPLTYYLLYLNYHDHQPGDLGLTVTLLAMGYICAFITFVTDELKPPKYFNT